MRHRLFAVALLLGRAAAVLGQTQDHADHSQHAPAASTESTVSTHVPPQPPTHPMGPMTGTEMIELMAMDDAASYGSVTIDQFEWREDDDALAWKASAWYGGDRDKLVFKTEGIDAGDGGHSRSELLWDRVMSRWWNLQAGARHDAGDGPSRTWAALGVQGLAPYWLDFDAAFYLGEQGRTALRVEARYDLRLTQRWILQPQLEANLYGKDDPERHLGSGLADVQAGLRLRYEIRREFAPYVGLNFTGLFGETADLARAAGGDDGETRIVAGFRVWF